MRRNGTERDAMGYVGWGEVRCDSMRCDSMRCDAIRREAQFGVRHSSACDRCEAAARRVERRPAKLPRHFFGHVVSHLLAVKLPLTDDDDDDDDDDDGDDYDGGRAAAPRRPFTTAAPPPPPHRRRAASSPTARRQRNFHCWNYRRAVAALARVRADDEYAFSSEKIQQNFSNYSAFHSRSKVRCSDVLVEASW